MKRFKNWWSDEDKKGTKWFSPSVSFIDENYKGLIFPSLEEVLKFTESYVPPEAVSAVKEKITETNGNVSLDRYDMPELQWGNIKVKPHEGIYLVEIRYFEDLVAKEYNLPRALDSAIARGLVPESMRSPNGGYTTLPFDMLHCVQKVEEWQVRFFSPVGEPELRAYYTTPRGKISAYKVFGADKSPDDYSCFINHLTASASIDGVRCNIFITSHPDGCSMVPCLDANLLHFEATINPELQIYCHDSEQTPTIDPSKIEKVLAVRNQLEYKILENPDYRWGI